MAIVRKPKAAAPAPARTEPEIEALIARGGGVAEASSEKDAAPAKTTNVVLRLPPGMVERVDAAVGRRSLRIPRHTWLLEAVLEKLDRETPS